MTHRPPPISCAARARPTAALFAGILALLAGLAMAQEAEDRNDGAVPLAGLSQGRAGGIGRVRALNELGTVRGRLVSVINSRDGSLDRYHKDKYALFGTLEVDLGDDATLATGISDQKTEADNVTRGGLQSFYADGGLIDWP